MFKYLISLVLVGVLSTAAFAGNCRQNVCYAPVQQRVVTIQRIVVPQARIVQHEYVEVPQLVVVDNHYANAVVQEVRIVNKHDNRQNVVQRQRQRQRDEVVRQFNFSRTVIRGR